VRVSISASRPIRQVIVVACLIVALAFAVVVVSTASMRAAVAQSAHSIATVAHTWSASFGANSLADGPNFVCGASSGGCP
jgi:hypothetical protein